MDTFMDFWKLNEVWKIIGQLQKGDKLSVQGNHIAIDSAWTLNWIMRQYRGDSRQKTLQYIERIMTITQTMLQQSPLAKQQFFQNNLLEGFEGLLRLRATYDRDVRFLAAMNSVVERMAIMYPYLSSPNPEHLRRLHQVHRDIFPNMHGNMHGGLDVPGSPSVAGDSGAYTTSELSSSPEMSPTLSPTPSLMPSPTGPPQPSPQIPRLVHANWELALTTNPRAL